MSLLPGGRRAALAAGVAVAALPLAAMAQTPRELPPISAEPAQPLADGEIGVLRLDGEALARRRTVGDDAMSLLSGQPGVALNGNGGISALPSVRGMADDRVLVTVDGVDITVFCPNHMNPAGSYVMAARAESISVVATLSPVSAGGDNIGGVIAVSSRTPEFTAGGLVLKGEAAANYRSVSDGAGASLRASAAGERYSLAYDAAWGRADNYRTGDGVRVRSSLYEAYDQALTLAARTDHGVLILHAGEQFVPYEGFPTQRMDMTENRSVFADAGYQATYDWGEVSAKLAWRRVDHEMNFLADKGGSATGGMPMNSRGRDLSASLALSVPLADGGAWRSGIEARRADLDDWWPPVAGSMMMSPLTYWNIRDGRRDRLALWSEWEARPSAAWTTEAGLRLERVETDAGPVQPYAWTGMMNMADAMAAAAFNARDHKRSDDNVDATLKAVWRPTDTRTLEVGYARKTRSPNLYERYAWGMGAMSSAMTTMAGDANSYVGNPDLKPEVAQSLATTFRITDGSQGRRSLTVSAYHSWVADYVDADKLADLAKGFVRLRFANHDARLWGFEVAGAATLWEDAALGRGTLTGSVSWVRGENSDTGDNLYHMAPLTGRLALEQAVGAWTHAAELELVGKKDRVNALRHEPVTGAYALANLRTSWKGGRLRVDLAAENLFDTAYDLPLGGVSYGDFRAGGSVAPIRALPGPGRSVNLGVTVAF